MALLFMDGFDANDAPVKWGGGVVSISNATTRFGTGLAFASNTGGVTPLKSFTASAQVFVGAAIYPTAQRAVWTLYADAATVAHLTLIYLSTGAFELRRGTSAGTIIATSAIVLQVNTWGYVEMSAIVSDTVGAVTVRLNGTAVITLTGADTKNAGTSTNLDAISLVQFMNYDDLYVCDGTGSVNNGFLGDVRVQTLMPTGAGASTQLTPSVGSNWDNVNDAPYVSTTYNSSSTAGQRDTYTMGDLIAGTGTVFAMQDTILSLKSDAGAASIKAAVKSGGTVYYDSTISLGTSLGAYPAVRETDPATAAAWTVANVNALEFGAEIV